MHVDHVPVCGPGVVVPVTMAARALAVLSSVVCLPGGVDRLSIAANYACSSRSTKALEKTQLSLSTTLKANVSRRTQLLSSAELRNGESDLYDGVPPELTFAEYEVERKGGKWDTAYVRTSQGTPFLVRHYKVPSGITPATTAASRAMKDQKNELCRAIYDNIKKSTYNLPAFGLVDGDDLYVLFDYGKLVRVNGTEIDTAVFAYFDFQKVLGEKVWHVRNGDGDNRVLKSFSNEDRASFFEEYNNLLKLSEKKVLAKPGESLTFNYRYFDCEHLGGKDLLSHIKLYTHSYVNAGLALKQILKELQKCHKLGYAHRDVKPENVIRLKDGTHRLIDFGMAAQILPGETMSEVCGTLEYMAPEVAAGGPYGLEADVYSAALTWWTLFQGEIFRKEMDGKEQKENLCEASSENMHERRDLKKFPPHALSGSMENLFKKMVDPLPTRRFSVDQCLKHCFFKELEDYMKKF